MSDIDAVSDLEPRRPGRAWDIWLPRPVAEWIARQCKGPVTRAQVTVDLVVGALLPGVLVWLDRFWDPLATNGVIPRGRVYVMLLAVLGSAGVVLFHATRTRAPFVAGAMAAWLGATGAFTLLVAIVLSPLSFVGILAMGVGLVGLLPFAIAFVHIRCALRAMHIAWSGAERGRALLAMAVVLFGALGAAAIGGKGAKVIAFRAQRVLMGETEGSDTSALRRLRVLWHFPGVPLFVLKQRVQEGTRAERDRAATLHLEITGRHHNWGTGS